MNKLINPSKIEVRFAITHTRLMITSGVLWLRVLTNNS